jgi:hypothetical protein
VGCSKVPRTVPEAAERGRGRVREGKGSGFLPRVQKYKCRWSYELIVGVGSRSNERKKNVEANTV